MEGVNFVVVGVLIGIILFVLYRHNQAFNYVTHNLRAIIDIMKNLDGRIKKLEESNEK